MNLTCKWGGIRTLAITHRAFPEIWTRHGGPTSGPDGGLVADWPASNRQAQSGPKSQKSVLSRLHAEIIPGLETWA